MNLARRFWIVFTMVVPLALLGAGDAPAFLQTATSGFRCVNGTATLTVARDPWRLSLEDSGGATRFAEAEPPAFQIAGQWVSFVSAGQPEMSGDGARFPVQLGNGTTARAEIRPFGKNGFRLLVRAAGDATGVRGATALGMVEEIYGFGEMWNGHVAQRGQAFDLWDKPGTPDECAYMPYYVSTANYAWFLNYGGRVHVDVGRRRADQIAFEAPAGELDLTLVAGGSIPAVVRNFLSVVGLPARPPRWAFQPWFWLMADPNLPTGMIETLKGEHFIEMVDKLHALSIPVGVTWFEPPWQDARTSFIPNPAFSRDLKGLVEQLAQRRVRTLAWTVPYTTNTASNWRDAVEHHYLAAKPGRAATTGSVDLSASGELAGGYYNSIDYYNPDAFRWWQQQIEKSLETGVRGFKLDAGQDLESDARLFGGRQGSDVHNAYGLEYNRVFFEALRKKLGDDFLMIPRAAWVGSSAFTNFKWPGDLSGTFANNGLPSSVYSSLSLAFCGIPFVSTDIGGFEDRPPPEHVWLRWAQFGAMIPGMQTLHMPWWFSPEAVAHFRYLAWLHTDLTPLWMSLAHEATATGTPVCRPLVWTFQDDIDCWRVDDEFTVGPSLLAAPMLNGNPDREIYLPAGKWHDFWDDRETVRGPAWVTWFKGWQANDKFPLYVREGAIIPLEVTNEFSGFGSRESAGYVTLAIWPKGEGASEFTLHDTEGPVAIRVARVGAGLQIGWDATRRNHLLRVHVENGLRAVGVSADGAALNAFASLSEFRAGGEGWCFDRTTRKLWIRRMNDGSAGAVVVRLTSAGN